MAPPRRRSAQLTRKTYPRLRAASPGYPRPRVGAASLIDAPNERDGAKARKCPVPPSRPEAEEAGEAEEAEAPQSRLWPTTCRRQPESVRRVWLLRLGTRSTRCTS